MKQMLSVQESIESSLPERHFGRAPYFLIHDTQSLRRHVMANPARDFPSGAGAAAAQVAVDQAVEQVISGHFGPHAAQVLAAAGIRMLLLPPEDLCVNEILQAAVEGRLSEQVDTGHEPGRRQR